MEPVYVGKARSFSVPPIAVGCMRIADMEGKQLQRHIAWCLQNGLNFFDHADIYGGGECERRFGDAISAMGIGRDALCLQSKCGIVPGVMHDLSAEHILRSVEGTLSRLRTDYLDVLLLHRPDALCEPEEVALAFDELERTGKVRRFGVSNFNPMQIELLKECVSQELLFNQLQMSLPVSGMIASGLEVNMMTDAAVNRDGYVLDYCRRNRITIQVWSPFQYGFFSGVFLQNRETFPELNQVLDAMAEKYAVTPTGIAAAWLLRHPARMQVVAGTTRTERMEEMIAGSKISLSREDWYKLYLAAGHILP